MWIVFASALAMAGPSFLGVELGSAPVANEEGVEIPFAIQAVHLAFNQRGEAVKVRCQPDGDRCLALDGPWPGRSFPLSREARSAPLVSGCTVQLSEGAATCTTSLSQATVAERSLWAPLVRSDLAGETGWAQPVELLVALGDRTRWGTGSADAFDRLSSSRALTITAELADRWRCDAAGSASLTDTPVTDARAGMAWLVEAETRCGAPPTRARAAFCAAVYDDDEADVVAWCAATPPRSPADGPVEVPHTLVNWKSRSNPPSPAEMDAYPFREVRCTARVQLNEGGVPTQVVVDGCPTLFHRGVISGLMQWRAQPVQVEGVATPVQTDIVVLFRRS